MLIIAGALNVDSLRMTTAPKGRSLLFLMTSYVNILRGKMKMNETFGKRLKKIRKQKGLTQWKLAEKIGISQQQLCLYEADKHVPSLTIFEWICTALGVSATELLGY